MKVLTEELTNTALNYEDLQKMVAYLIVKNAELQKENEELKEELKITYEKWNKDKQWSECRTKEWLDYKQRKDNANEFCDYLLEHNEVVIDGKTYIKQSSDDVITNAIKSKLLGGDE